MLKNPYQNYKQQSVMTMTPGEMLTMLYDEIVKQLNTGKIAIRNKDLAATNQALQKAQRILSHLIKTLDDSYPVSQNLSSLYDYFKKQIIQANIKKDVSPLDEIIPMIIDLRDTYVQADKLTRTQTK